MITQIASRQSQQRLTSWSAAPQVDRKSELRNVLFVLAAAALTFVLASYVAYRRFSLAHPTSASSATLQDDLAYCDPTTQFGVRPLDRFASR